MSDFTQILFLGVLEKNEVDAIESALQKVTGSLDKEQYKLRKVAVYIYYFQWQEFFKVSEFLRHLIKIEKDFNIRNVLLLIKEDGDYVFKDIRIFTLIEDPLSLNVLSFGNWIHGEWLN